MAGKKFKCPKCGSADDFLISGIAHDKVMYLCEIQVTGEVDTIDLQHEEIVSTIWDDIFKCEGCGEKYSRREIAGKPPKAEKIMCPEGRLSFDPVIEQWEINAQGVFGPYATVRRCEGIPIKDTETIAKTISRAGSMAKALCAIAGMKIQEDTNKEDLLALCMAIAKIEIDKIKAAGENQG